MRYGFAGCVLDTGRMELHRDGARVAVEPQVLELLIMLVENRDRLVTRDAILAEVWKGRIVSDAALSSRIKAARRAVGDDGQAQRLIETLHGRGFRFRGAVEGEAEGAPAPAPRPPTGADGPAIAVLPFLDRGSPPDPVLAQGIAEELIASLGRFRWFPVIARDSVMALHGRGLDPGAIAAALGVAYLVEGSVLRHGREVRVHARLIEAASGRQVAAARLDRTIDNVFTLLDEIGAELVQAIHPGLIGAELERATRAAPSEATAWQLFIRAQTLLAGPSGAANAEARALIEAAIAAEPGAGRSHAALALTHLWDITFGWTPDPAASGARAQVAASRALALAPADSWALLAYGCCRLMARDHAGALAELRRAVEAEPASALAHGTLALALAFAGEAEAALESVDRAARLSPFDPRSGIWINAEGVAAVLSGRFERALAAGRRLATLKPDYPAGHRIMAAAAAGLGDAAAAREAAARLLELLPEHRAAQAGAALPFGSPALAEAYVALLVAAGLPR